MLTLRSLVGAVALLLPSAAEAAALCGREVVSIEQMVGEIKSQPGAAVLADTREFIALVEPGRQTLWTFAKPVQPLGSAYICRQVVQRDGKIMIDLNALCQGPKADCDALIARILADQERATAQFRTQ